MVSDKGTDGEVANALVCKTSIHGFKSHSVLQQPLLEVVDFGYAGFGLGTSCSKELKIEVGDR